MQPIDADIRENIINSQGNIVISASAGTGKTYTTIQKIRHEIQRNGDFRTFAAITFTRKAAKEIENRLGVGRGEGFVGTNDTFVLQEVVYPFMYDVYGREYKKKMSPDYSNENRITNFNEGVNNILKNGKICKYYNNKQNFSFQLGLYILKKSDAAKLYLKSKYYRIYVDEYQDSDYDMHQFFMYICKDLGIDLFIVGDLKQSIYGWRGGFIDGFKNILQDGRFNGFELRHNFRSVIGIQNYANIFMEDVRKDFKKIDFDNSVCCFAYMNRKYALEEIAQWLDKEKNCAFLIRKKVDGKKWALDLKENGLDFILIPASPLDDSELESEHVWIVRLLAFFLLREIYSEYDFYDEIPNSDAYNFVYIRGLLQQIEANRLEHDVFKEKVFLLYEYLGYDFNINVDNEVEKLFEIICEDQYISTYNPEKYEHVITTIHAAKGLQYKQVIIIAEDYNLDTDDNNLHYVAVTRPEQRLLVLCNWNEKLGKEYCKKIESNVQAINEMGIHIKRQDIAECINSIEFLSEENTLISASACELNNINLI